MLHVTFSPTFGQLSMEWAHIKVQNKHIKRSVSLEVLFIRFYILGILLLFNSIIKAY
jgi:hypothetical protein